MEASEAVVLCPQYNLYLKPISRVTVSVSLPLLKTPGRSVSSWEVMERLKAMVKPETFSSLRISKSTVEFLRFEGEVENRSVVKRILGKLEGKTIKLSGFTDPLKIRSVENKVDFPTRHDWDSFFRDANDMNETVPGERPDTVHLEGLPCRWFTQKGLFPERPSEMVLQTVFQCFGPVRAVDIPMLDPYRQEERSFSTFSFGGNLHFEGYVQYEDHSGFVRAMDALRGMKLMLRGDDGKEATSTIKVTFDTTKHLSESSLKKRQQERQKLQELEKQREEQKRREKEEEERKKEEERKQREQEQEEKLRRREEKLRRKEQKLMEKQQKKQQREQEQQQRKLQIKIRMEERKLLLAQRNLQSIRLVAELLNRAKQQELEKQQRLRQTQAEELRRVEAQKSLALDLQRKEQELRQRILGNLINKSKADTPRNTETVKEGQEGKQRKKKNKSDEQKKIESQKRKDKKEKRSDAETEKRESVQTRMKKRSTEGNRRNQSPSRRSRENSRRRYRSHSRSRSRTRRKRSSRDYSRSRSRSDSSSRNPRSRDYSRGHSRHKFHSRSRSGSRDSRRNSHHRSRRY
ncbi:hypothetical protein DNTS_019002 [Danionella cerebrum]|uniref:RRM domain-containing protein n=1 Tax=Danionella cerebrum TaxID=2873325 RepID=A0A553RJK9_9TELE|nr:hypothetical protein DNTS_019002 [Danionella translucida]